MRVVSTLIGVGQTKMRVEESLIPNEPKLSSKFEPVQSLRECMRVRVSSHQLSFLFGHGLGLHHTTFPCRTAEVCMRLFSYL